MSRIWNGMEKVLYKNMIDDDKMVLSVSVFAFASMQQCWLVSGFGSHFCWRTVQITCTKDKNNNNNNKHQVLQARPKDIYCVCNAQP